MPVPGLSLLVLKCIRGFVSILRYINPTISIINGKSGLKPGNIFGIAGYRLQESPNFSVREWLAVPIPELEEVMQHRDVGSQTVSTRP